jgi:hypothetical protein
MRKMTRAGESGNDESGNDESGTLFGRAHLRVSPHLEAAATAVYD